MPRKVKPGMDTSKKAEGYYDNQDVEFEEESGSKFSGIITLRDLLIDLKNELSVSDFELVANPEGKFGGFDVYYKTSLQIPGLSAPEDFKYKKLIRLEDSTHTQLLLSKIKAFCDSRAREAFGELKNKPLGRLWCDLANYFDCRLSDTKSTLYQTSRSFAQDHSRQVTLTGLSNYHKVVPRLDWFPKNLQEYNPEDLLTIFPDAEREMLCLLLGRAMVGAKDTLTAEGWLRHSARSYGILVGGAGMGKSTLINYVTQTMELLGYTVATINGNFGKFGWGRTATSDLAFIDDLTIKTQQELMANSNTKTIVSNDVMAVEEKGIPAYSVKSTTVILGCSNHSDPHFFLGLDPGSLSRVNQLQTLSQEETSARYPGVEDARLRGYWDIKAKELGCNVTLLAARLLQHCAYKFLDTIGCSFDEEGRLVKGEDNLEAVTKDLRSQFRIRIGLGHAEELPQVASNLVALAIASHDSPKEINLMTRNLEHLEFDYRLLRATIETFVRSNKIGKDFQDFIPKYISKACVKPLDKKWSDLKNMDLTESAEVAFTKLIKELVSLKDNFGYPPKPSFYQTYWKPELHRLPFRIDSIKEFYQQWLKNNNADSLPDELEAILEDVRGVLKSI